MYPTREDDHHIEMLHVYFIQQLDVKRSFTRTLKKIILLIGEESDMKYYSEIDEHHFFFLFFVLFCFIYIYIYIYMYIHIYTSKLNFLTDLE